MTWCLSTVLGVGNGFGFLFISTSEPLTTFKAAMMAHSLFSSVFSYLTPVFLTLLRTIAHAQTVHLWMADFSFKEQLVLVQEMLGANNEVLSQICKQLDKSNRGDKAEE